MMKWAYLGLALLLFLGACNKEDKQLESDARDVAEKFHTAVGPFDTKTLLRLVDYPFRLDGKIVHDEQELLEALLKKKVALRRAVSPATRMEVVSYESFIDGKPLSGRSFSPEEARAQADKIGFKKGGVLVRCYHEEDGQEDGRQYFLVMHPDALGDLRITSYHD